MSKFAVKGIVAAVLAVAASAGIGADSTTLSVTARIQGGCVVTTSGPMAFGDLNMASSNAETKVVNASYKCASGVTVLSFTVGGDADGDFDSAMALSTNSAVTIPYKITWTPVVSGAFTGTGFNGTGVTIPLTGTIQNAAYISKPTGSYSDSVQLTVNY